MKKTKAMFAGLVLVSLISLGYAEYMVWNSTVTWLTAEFTAVIQEDNSFLAQSR
jgi:hypothetical protein